MKIAASACANAVGCKETPIAAARMPAMDSQSTVCCCARAVIGHVAAALPRSVMNSRRLIGSSEAQDKPQYRFKQALRKGRLSGQPCPLWVTSRHFAVQLACLLYPRKRTLAAVFECPLRANSGHSAFWGWLQIN